MAVPFVTATLDGVMGRSPLRSARRRADRHYRHRQRHRQALVALLQLIQPFLDRHRSHSFARGLPTVYEKPRRIQADGGQ